LRRDERLRIVDPPAQVALCRIDVREDIAHQHAVLVLDHRWAGDYTDVSQFAQRNCGTRLTPLIEKIGRVRGGTHRQ